MEALGARSGGGERDGMWPKGQHGWYRQTVAANIFFLGASYVPNLYPRGKLLFPAFAGVGDSFLFGA